MADDDWRDKLGDDLEGATGRANAHEHERVAGLIAAAHDAAQDAHDAAAGERVRGYLTIASTIIDLAREEHASSY